MTRPLSYLGYLRHGFVAHLAERLVDMICSETAAVAESAGIVAPVRTHSALLYLLIKGPATMAEMARSDNQSHQLAASRLGPLESLELIERFQDPADLRRRPFRLTPAGRKEAGKVRAAIDAHARAQRDIADETGIDLLAQLDIALEAFPRLALSDRIQKHLADISRKVEL
jgi:DNA-binding MarR family transcriptional regulator